MQESRHFGLVGGLGVGATVLYYQAIATACAKQQIVPRLTVAHAHAPTALAHVEADRIEALATYLGGFVRELAAAGAGFFAIPAITPHICRAQLQREVAIPMVDILATTAATAGRAGNVPSCLVRHPLHHRQRNVRGARGR